MFKTIIDFLFHYHDWRVYRNIEMKIKGSFLGGDELYHVQLWECNKCKKIKKTKIKLY